MFDNLKNLYQLKKQAEELQKQMAGELFSATSGSVTITINGNTELTDVRIADNAAMDAKQLERDIRNAYRQAQDQMKKTMASKFQGMM